METESKHSTYSNGGCSFDSFTNEKCGAVCNTIQACKSSPSDPSLQKLHQNGLDCHQNKPSFSVPELVKRRKQVIGGGTQIHYPEAPLKIVRGRGQYLYDENGRQYLDLMNNVAHVGHCHPHVVKVGQDQMAELCTNSRFLHDEIVEYAQRLVAKCPKSLTHVYMVCTGTEATDLAYRLARNFTRKKDALVVDRAYHGHSVTVIDLSPYKFKLPKGDGQQDYIHVAPSPDTYRGMFIGDRNDPELGRRYAEEAAKVCDQARLNGREIGMFIAESMQSCGGQIIYPPGYLSAVYKHVREHGGVCVADEVQVGFGRAGSKGFWAFEMHGVVPDIVTIGKPMGNGHPVAAVITTKEISDAFGAWSVPYFNTFGGNPVSCAIANAVLDVIEEEHLQEHAEDVGVFWIGELEKIKQRHKLIGDIRGVGLFIGIEITKDRLIRTPGSTEAKTISYRLRERGILISVDGCDDNVLKIKPPMVVQKDDAVHFNQQLEEVLYEVQSELDAGMPLQLFKSEAVSPQ